PLDYQQESSFCAHHRRAVRVVVPPQFLPTQGSVLQKKNFRGKDAGPPRDAPKTAPGARRPTALAAAGTRPMPKGKLKAAARHLKESLRQDPQHFAALEALGVLCGMAGDTEEAAKLLRRAMERNPAAPSAPMNLGLALMQLSRMDEAAAAFETAARLD